MKIFSFISALYILLLSTAPAVQSLIPGWHIACCTEEAESAHDHAQCSAEDHIATSCRPDPSSIQQGDGCCSTAGDSGSCSMTCNPFSCHKCTVVFLVMPVPVSVTALSETNSLPFAFIGSVSVQALDVPWHPPSAIA